jgi:hypothetical protein
MADKRPGKGVKPMDLRRRVDAALAEVFGAADAVLIIASKVGGQADTGEVLIMRHAGSTLTIKGAVLQLVEEGFIYDGMLDAGSETAEADDEDDAD